MARFRVWRFRRRYRKALGQLAAEGQSKWGADLEAAVDKFRDGISKVTTEEWQRYGLHERKWR